VRMETNSNNHPLRLLRSSEPNKDEADSALLDSVKAGNVRSAAAFHDRILPIVTRTVGRLLGGRDPDYDDVTQLALIELVVTVDKFLGQCPLDAWTSIVSARVVYRHLRRRKIERRLFVLQGLESIENTARAPSNQATLRIAIRQIESLLATIDEKKAWTFVLHDVHGYSLAEISEITGGSLAAVQSRLVRARKELHARIAESRDLAPLLVDLLTQDGGVS
jgi:RNA polymerase sigma factor (sigma-70 family)